MKDVAESAEAGLPPELVGQFDGLRRGLQLRRTLLAVSWGVGGLLLSFMALFVWDRLTDTPVWIRFVLLCLGCVAPAAALAWWLLGGVRRRGEVRSLAALVQRRHPRLGDGLLGIVELASGEQIPDGMSTALCRAAIRQVAAEALRVDFSLAVDWRRARAMGTLAGLLGCLVMGVLIAAFDAGRNTFSRWVSPTSSIPRYTFVTVEGLPKLLIVPHGEPFELRAPIRFHSFWKPTRAVARAGTQFPLTIPLSNQVAVFKFGGQDQAVPVEIRCGDGRGVLGVQPVLRPSIRSLEAVVRYPEYLDLRNQVSSATSGTFVFVTGSQASFRGEVSRALTNVVMSIGASQPQTLATQQARFESPSVVLEGNPEIRFEWRDTFGLGAAVPWKLSLQEVPDEAPRVAMVDLPATTALLVTEMMELRVMAQDDFGVRDVSIKWESTSPDGPAMTRSDGENFTAQAQASDEKQLEHVFRFSPVLLGIKEDSVVELRARATDRFPGRTPSESTLYRIFVVSPERHAELVRQQLESILTRVEEVTRQEESVLTATQALAERKDIESAEAAAKAGELADQQEQNSKALDELSKDGAQVLREAMRNSTFSQQNLQEWAKNLAAMQRVAQQPMQQAKAALEQAKADASKRQAQSKNAEQKEEESLRALERIQRRMNTGLDNLQAMTLAQRLRKLAEQEGQFEAHLQKLAPETVGLLPEELDPKQRSRETEVADDQIEAQAQAVGLQSEISRFFDRTQNGPYGEVSKEMIDSRLALEMERISGMIRSNIVMDASQELGGWSKRLTDWAVRLEPKPDEEESSASSASGEPGAPDEAMMKQIMALLRLRDRQSTMLNMTRSLEDQRAKDPAYGDRAKILASTQKQITGDFRQVRVENRLPNLAQAYEDAFEPINQSGLLLSKPQTDAATQKVERSAVEHLTDLVNLINELTQSGPKSSSSSGQSAEAEMEFMMQMAQQQASAGMNMEPGENPGTSRSGGTTNRRGEAFQGSVQGRAANSRTNQRIGGDSKTVPVEFREALENYFRALEKEGLQ